MKETQFIDDRTLRDKNVEHYEVLEKVKELFLLPGEDVATQEQVASFYEVDKKAIEKVCARHSNELESDGMCMKKYTELSNLHYVGLKTSKGKVSITFDNGNVYDYPTRGTKVFPRRAILRIGMLLRDSEVAKEVRTQLLNIEEKTSTETKIEDINEEQNLMLSVGMAVASGDANAVAIASANLVAFKNRHIEKLTMENDTLNEFYDDLMNTEGLISINTMAKELRIGEYKLFEYLRNKKVFFYDKNMQNVPYERFRKENKFVVKEVLCKDGLYRSVTYATKKGLDYVRKLLRKDGYYDVKSV